MDVDVEVMKLLLENGRISYAEYRFCMVKWIIQIFEKYGDYIFVQNLGKGTFGDVVELLEPDGQSSVAVKVILKEQQNSVETLMWPKFSHKNIQCVMEDIHIEPVQAHAYLMTRQMDTLSRILKRKSFFLLPDALLSTKRWLADILEGLDHLHKRNICHLDIKAENVLISYEMTAVLSDFSTIQSTKQRTSRFGAHILNSPPEACPSRGAGVEVEGTSFDLWTVGVLALRMFTGEYIKLRLKRKINWIEDVYPILFEVIQERKFRSLVKADFPASNADKELLRDMRNFVLSLLIVDPEDRPSAQLMLEHDFLERGYYNFCPDRIWITKVSSPQLKMLVTMLHDQTDIESVIKPIAFIPDTADHEESSDRLTLIFPDSIEFKQKACQNSEVDSAVCSVEKRNESQLSNGENNEDCDDSCLLTDTLVESKIIDKDDLKIQQDTTSKECKVIVDDDLKNKEESSAFINATEKSSLASVASDSEVVDENIHKNTNSIDVKGRLIDDLSGSQINLNTENYTNSGEKPNSKEDTHSSDDSSGKLNLIPIVRKSDDKVCEKQLITEADTDEPVGAEVVDKDTIESVKVCVENDNSGLQRKTLCRRIRGWFRKRWTGVRKCVVCGCKQSADED